MYTALLMSTFQVTGTAVSTCGRCSTSLPGGAYMSRPEERPVSDVLPNRPPTCANRASSSLQRGALRLTAFQAGDAMRPAPDRGISCCGFGNAYCGGDGGALP